MLRTVSEPVPSPSERTEEEEERGGMSSDGSGAGPELDGAGSSQSGTESSSTTTTPKSGRGLERSGSGESGRPGLATLIAKDACSLTFQWERGLALKLGERGEFVNYEGPVTFRAEVQQVQLSTTGGLSPPLEWTQVYEGRESWVQVTRLRPGTLYAVRIFEKSLKKEGCFGAYSEVAYFKTTPTKPGELHAPLLHRRHSRTIKLKWSPPEECGGGKNLEYAVYAQTARDTATTSRSKGFELVYRGTSHGCKVNHLTPGRRYCFRMKAVNEVGEGPWSATSMYATKSLVPKEPMGLRAIQTPPQGHDMGQSLIFQWYQPEQEGPPPTSFSVELEDVSAGTKKMVSCGPAMYAQVDDLNAAWEYSARVQAANEHGVSQWSFEYRFVTLAASPCAPAHPRLSDITESTAILRWDPPPRGGGCIINHYTVELLPVARAATEKVEEVWHLIYKDLDRGCKVAGLEGGRSYRLRIRAASEANYTGPYNCLEFQTMAIAPEAPGIPYAVERTTQTMQLSWKPPRNDGGAPIEEYVLQTRVADHLAGLDGDAPFQTVYRGEETVTSLQNLKPDSLYAIRVQAKNVRGPSAWTVVTYESTKALTLCRPLEPAVTSACTSLDLDWTSASFELNADTYELEMVDVPTLRKFVDCGTSCSQGRESMTSSATFISLGTESAGEDSEEQPFRLAYRGEETRCRIDGLEPSTEYLLRLRYQSSSGFSEWSQHSVAKTLLQPPQEPPSLVLEDITASSFGLQWTSKGDTEPSLAHVVEVAERIGRKVHWTVVYTGQNTTHQVSNLSSGTEYNVRICSRNDAGQGPYSNPLSVCTLVSKPQTPHPPSVAHLTPTAVRLEWKEVSGAQSYRLQMAEGSGEFSEAFLGSISSFQVRSLTPGQTYRFQLCGTNKGGDGKWSEALEITTPLKWPKAPTGLKVEINTPVVGERSICALLTWSPPAPHQDYEEVCAYEIEAVRGTQSVRSHKSSAVQHKLNMTTNDNQCVLDDLQQGLVYQVRVRASGPRKKFGRWSDALKMEVPAIRKTNVKNDNEGLPERNISVPKTQPEKTEVSDVAEQSNPRVETCRAHRTEARAVPRNSIVQRSPQMRPRPQQKTMLFQKIIKFKRAALAAAVVAVAVAYCSFE